MQPQLPPTEKQRKQQEYWDAVKEQGPVYYVIKNVIILLCVYEFGWLTWGYFYRRGWSHTPARFSIEDIIIDVVCGVVGGLWEFSRMKRKFEPRDPGTDQTMI
jgi:hypothetical protein